MKNMENNIMNKIENRQKYNEMIVAELSDIVFRYPSLRFCQILSILRCDGDNFNEEPEDTYNKIIEYRKNYNL